VERRVIAAEEYRRRYDVVAQYHLEHHRATGQNPWMDFEPQLRSWTVGRVRALVPKGSSILDAGCGVGLMLADLDETYAAEGIDISGEYVEYAVEQGLRAREGWLEQMPFYSGAFDAVVCCDVFEHVLKPDLVLAELRRVVRAGGLIIARVPNGACTQVGARSQFGFPVHLQSWDADSFVEFLGGDVVVSEVWDGAGPQNEEILVAVRR
jgi:2-polyprenyl-3-methyl-5-hydroxy-6-metoxy-1,4-benzoquinol methylase